MVKYTLKDIGAKMKHALALFRKYSVSQNRRSSWKSPNDHVVAIVGTVLMGLGSAILTASYLSPYWFTWTSMDKRNNTMSMREGLWVLCPVGQPESACISKEEAGDAPRTVAVWLLTLSVLFSAIAVFFITAFLAKLYIWKACRWAKLTTSAVFGLASGITSLVSVVCMAGYKLTTENTGRDGVISISYGWSFVLSACQLPFIFAASSLFLVGGRTGINVGDAKDKDGEEQATTVPMNAAPAEEIVNANIPEDSHV